MEKVKQVAKKIANRVPVLKDQMKKVRVLQEEKERLLQENERLSKTQDNLIDELDSYKNCTIDQMEKMAVERPFDIAIETYTRCNSKCVFCAYRKVRRKKELMSMELFEKICRDYVGIGGGPLGFAPLLADPLIDPFLMDRIRLARKWHPSIRMYIFTNAIQLSRYSDEDILFVLDSIGGMNISLSVLSREEYKKMFQVDKYDAVMKNIQRIHRLSREIDSPPDIYFHVRTSRVKESLESETYKKFIDMGLNCGDITDVFTDWGGIIKEEDLPEGTQLLTRDNSRAGIEVPCLIPMVSLTISANGDVLACGCFDAGMENIIGNVGRETLHEIWHGDKLKAFRESFRKKQLAEICISCAQYTAYRNIFSLPFFIGFTPQSHSFWASLYHKKPYGTNIMNKKEFRFY